MIVRIATEGQYQIDSTYLDQLNKIDNELVSAIANADEARFHTLLKDLISLVKEHGTPIPPEELVESDLVLPPSDTSFTEAAELFAGDGLIPN